MAIVFRLRRPARDARPARDLQSDARHADRRGQGAPPDPDAERRQRFRRRVGILVLSVVFLLATAAALFGERGYLDCRRSHRELEALQKKVDEQLSRVIALKGEVRSLRSDPGAIERIAREELGLAKPGEIQLLLPREEEEWGGPTGEGATTDEDSASVETERTRRGDGS